MSFSRKVQYFLVHTLMLSNKDARLLIENGKVEIDGVLTLENCFLEKDSEIKVNGEIKRAATKPVYLRFYKPAGFESTLNQAVNNNLSDFFRHIPDLAIAGRLDKDSEGLLLLSNNGKWIEKVCNPQFEKEKEYLVELDKHPDQLFIDTFKKGMCIGKHITLPCDCAVTDKKSIKVILKEGKNRQIRRMCEVLGYRVQHLKRIRIAELFLGDLKAGEMAIFTPDGD